jgi:Fe-Mn family superoxide dismutase
MSHSTTSERLSLTGDLVRASMPLETRTFDFSNVEGLSQGALEIHRSLYEGYVKEANALLPLLYANRGADEPSQIERLRYDGMVRRYAFEKNGALLHELFFEALRGRSDPPRTTGVFLEAIDEGYGSFNAWKNDMRKLAETRGIGWVLTLQSAGDGRINNIWVDEHSHGLLADAVPILAIDLWEHAYLIDFKPSERLQYLQTVFDNIDWQIVEARCF